METKRARIVASALKILKASPNGIRWAELLRRVQEELPDIKTKIFAGTLWNLDAKIPDEVYKPARGIWRHTSFKESVTIEVPPIEVAGVPPPAIAKTREEDFYQPFAVYLVTDLEECTKAIALGGNRFKDKWGTPDVIGVREPRRGAIVKSPTEIVSAEIKIDTASLITAFGQACSYRAFSHKTYIVIPQQSSEEDKQRLEILCMVVGIGLILFDASSPKEPKFDIRTRAARQEPDMFYVNKYMPFVEKELFS